ncbi:MAG: hypothetical protein KDD02_25395 [Phaeodactylibacter sp.]|nr:hypothetical protein [Phaeodactylibacter sp.]MCB9302399.1 hypothetical protein [Lewinellaceae bacterium]
MKTSGNFFFLLAISLSAFTIWSCNNDDDIRPEGQGQMSAIVSGEDWEAQTVSAGLVQGQFAISGIAADGSTISLRLDGFGQGEYPSYSGTSNACVWQPSAGAFGFVSNAPMGLGRVLIEEVNEQDTLISGAFFFLAQEPATGDTVTVVDGVFTDVKYQIGAAPVGDNFLKVKIDGQLWEAEMVAGFAGGGQLNISGTSTDASRTVALFIPSDITPGDYDLDDPFSSDYAAQYNPNSQTTLMADGGALKITTHDKVNKVIEGTFSFEASEFIGPASASLTGGSFYLKY